MIIKESLAKFLTFFGLLNYAKPFYCSYTKEENTVVYELR